MTYQQTPCTDATDVVHNKGNKMFNWIKNYLLKEVRVSFVNQAEFNQNVVAIINDLVERVAILENPAEK